MANLGPLYQNQTYSNLLQIDGGLTAELKPVLDGDGNASGLTLSLTGVGVSNLVADSTNNLNGGLSGTVPYQVAPNVTGFTAVGTAGYVLASAGIGAPVWTNTIENATNSSFAVDVFGGSAGQVLYQAGADNTAFTAVGALGQVLVSGGAAAPYWSNSVPAAGTAGTATNLAGGLPGSLPYQSGAGLTAYVPSGTSGQVLRSQGSAAPLWSTMTASDVGALPLSGVTAMTGNLSMGNNAITNLLNPLASTDAATKGYVDSVATGLKIKAACRVASTANLVLSGLIAVDGVTVSSGDRVLVKNQTAEDNNGIYVASTTAWARATDADTWDELVGATVFISAGNTQISSTWACNITAGGTIGVTPVTFALFGASISYTAGNGLTLTGSQFALATPVSVANGGSGVTTLTGIIKGNGASAFTAATGADVVSLIGATEVQNATTAGSCSGNALTATTLQTARTINGVSFNGSANITVTANTTGSLNVVSNGLGDAAPFSFNGSTTRDISWNSIGAASAAGTNATGTWPISITGNAANVTSVVAVATGGTGFSTYATGDILVAASPTALAKLTVGAENNILQVYSGVPTWRNVNTALGLGTMATQNASAVAITGGAIDGVTIGNTTASGANFTSLNTTGTVQLSGLITVNSTAAFLRTPRIWDDSQTNWYRITPSELAADVYTTLPALAGNDTFVFQSHAQTLTNKTISGATNTLSNIGNAALTNSSITINGTSVSLGGSVTIGVGTVTSVTGVAPVLSTGGATPAISLQNGYGDTQNPYLSKTAGFVLAAPSGAAGVPTFRALVASDVPTLNQNTTGTAANVTGIVSATNGGTGYGGPSAYLTGDLLYASSATALSKLGISGTADRVLFSNGIAPAWGQINLATAVVTGTLPIGRGGTGQTTYTDGQLLIGNTTGGTLTKSTLTAGPGISITNGSGSITITATGVGLGTVTSVGMTVPTGMTISGSPVTSAGTLALGLAAGYSIPTTTSQATWDTAYTDRFKWDGGLSGLNPATGRTSLGGSTIGQNLFTLTNPSVVSFPRFNADNTISALDAASFRSAIGAGTSSTTGTVTSVSGAGTVSGITLSGTVTSTGNLNLSGTLSVTPSNFSAQTANTFLAAPNGAAGAPTFRGIVAADVPTLNQNTTGTAGNVTGIVALVNGGTGANNIVDARANLGLGTIATQNINSVSITGGSINGTSVGATTASTGAFTGLTASGAVNFSTYITVDPLVSAYFRAPRIWDTSATHWYRMTPSELALDVFTTLPALTGNDTFVFNNHAATLTNKTISGATNTLSNIANSSLSNSTITINGNVVSLGGSITVSGLGTVTSVGMTVPTGLTVTGSPITASGTLAVGLAVGYSIPTLTSQSNWDTAYTDRFKWDGSSSGLVAATGRTSLGGTTIGQNLFTLTNPAAVTFPRFNADNTVSALDAATFRAAIGAGTSSTTGTVTSVGMVVPTGLTVTGSPITSSGTFNLGLAAGYSIPTTASQANWNAAYTQRLQWDGSVTGLNAVAGRNSLGGTTIGQNLFTLTNPTGITFPRFNADSTVSALDAASFRAAIGAGTSSNVGTVTSVSGTGTVSGITLTGTVTSSGSLTLGGTLAVGPANFSTQAANSVLAGPNGVAGVPTFRSLVAADIPILNQNTTGTAANVTGVVAIANGGTGQTTYTNGQLLIGNTTGNTLTKATLTAGSGITITNGAGSITIAATTVGTGTVTSVGMTVPTGLTVTGSPITTSGTLALGLAAGYSIPTTTAQSNWDTAYAQRQQWSGGSTNLVPATARASLGGTTIGQNLFTLTNPTGVCFPRFNSDSTVSVLDAASFRAAIGVTPSQWTTSGTSIYYNTGNVGVGVSAPSYKLDIAGDVNLTGALRIAGVAGTAGQVLTSGGAGAPAVWAAPATSGTVTSVSMTVPTGLTITGSPVTSSGTLALGLSVGYSIPTTAKQGDWDNAYAQRLQWDGGSTNLVAATGRTSLGLGTIATQAANAVSITGGSVSNLATLSVTGNTYLCTSSGNVGIGTTSPSYKLDVSGQIRSNVSTNTYAFLVDNGTYSGGLIPSSATGGLILYNAVAQPLGFWTNNVERMRIDASGNVGIGTSSPSYKLDVAGDINLTGAVRVAGSAGTSGQVLTSSGGGAVSWSNGAAQAIPTSFGSAIANANNYTLSYYYGENLSVTFFGASPSASAATNNTAFQNAITYCATNQKGLYIPAGTFELTAQLNVDGHIAITSDKAARLHWASFTSGSIGFYFTWPSSSTTNIGSIQLPTLTGPAYGTGTAIKTNGISVVDIDVQYINLWDVGIHVYSGVAQSQNMRCTWNTMDDCTSGLKLEAGAYWLSEGHFRGCTIGVSLKPIELVGMSAGVIESCNIHVDSLWAERTGTGGCIFAYGNSIQKNNIIIHHAQIAGSGITSQLPMICGDQTSNGQSGYFGGYNNFIQITPILSTNNPVAGDWIKYKMVNFGNKIKSLCYDLSGTALTNAQVSTTQGEANFNGGVGSAIMADNCNFSLTISGTRSAGQVTTFYAYHQCLTGSTNKPITIIPTGAYGNVFSVVAYDNSSVANREIKIYVQNIIATTASYTLDFYLSV